MLLGLHGEPGGEHLRQYDEVGGTGERRQQPREVRAIGCGVLPDERLLRELTRKLMDRSLCSRVYALMRAAASVSVSSRLATHSRTMRMAAGGSR